jgi:carboxylesterase type B
MINVLLQILSETMFVIPALREVEAKHQTGWPVWLYVTEHYNPTMFPPNLTVKGIPSLGFGRAGLGAFHAELFSYMFELHALGPFEFDNRERRMQATINDAIVAFARTG